MYREKLQVASELFGTVYIMFFWVEESVMVAE